MKVWCLSCGEQDEDLPWDDGLPRCGECGCSDGVFCSEEEYHDEMEHEWSMKTFALRSFVQELLDVTDRGGLLYPDVVMEMAKKGRTEDERDAMRLVALLYGRLTR